MYSIKFVWGEYRLEIASSSPEKQNNKNSVTMFFFVNDSEINSDHLLSPSFYKQKNILIPKI